MPVNSSLVDIKPATNSTHDLCLFDAYQKLKKLSFFDLAREEKLNDIQKNLECALEKYDEKIEKRIQEDKLSLMDRTINLLNTVSAFFSNNVASTHKFNQKYQIVNRKQEYQIIYTRNF